MTRSGASASLRRVTGPGDLGRELMRRRVPHAALFYFGVSWGLLEFTSYLEDRYELTKTLGDSLLAVAAIMLPATLIVAWTHGKPGRDPWGRLEKLALAVSAVVAAAAIFVIGSRTPEPKAQETGAQTESKPKVDPAEIAEKLAREDEAPVAVDLSAPSRSRPCVMLFPLAGSVSEEDRPLRAGILTVADELLTDLPVARRSRAWSRARRQLQDSKVDEGVATPRSLMVELSRKYACDRYVHGTIERTGEDLALTLSISKLGEDEETTSIDGGSVMKSTNAVATWLGEKLALDGEPPSVPTVEDRFTTNPEALALYLSTRDPFRVRDRKGEDEKLAAALELDPTFVKAAERSFGSNVFEKESGDTLREMESALEHAYRLAESEQLGLSAFYFMLQGEFSRAERACARALKKSPDDVEALKLLASIRAQAGEIDGALEAFEAALEVDPSDLGAVSEAEGLYARQRRHEDAVRMARIRVSLRPEDSDQHIALGNQLINAGKFEDARTAFEDASVLEPESTVPDSKLAEIEIRGGDFRKGLEESRRLVDAAKAKARPDEMFPEYHRVAIQHASFLIVFGRADEAHALIRPIAESIADPERKDMNAMTRLGQLVPMLVFYGMAGEREAGMKLLHQVEVGQVPMLQMMRISGEIGLLADGEDNEKAIELGKRVTELLEKAPMFEEMLGPVFLMQRHLMTKEWQKAIEVWENNDQFNLFGTLDSMAMEPLLEVGRYEDAKRLAEQLLLSYPNLTGALVVLARAQWGLGEHEQAKKTLDRALALYADADPDHAPFLAAQEVRSEFSVTPPAG